MKLNFTSLIFLFGFLSFSRAFNIRLTSNCNSTIWPAWWGKYGTPHGGGTTLEPGQQIDLEFPKYWLRGSAIWARTGCDDKFNCESGSCGNQEQCHGTDGDAGPTTAAFVNGIYYVGMVSGFNIQIQIKPHNGTEDCKTAGECNVDILAECPDELRRDLNGHIVECLNPCFAFGEDEECCKGDYEGPENCKPTKHSQFFKDRCPITWSHPLDGKSNFLQCDNADFEIIFC